MALASSLVMCSEHSMAWARIIVSLTLRALTHTRPFIPTATSKGVLPPSVASKLLSGANSFLIKWRGTENMKPPPASTPSPAFFP